MVRNGLAGPVLMEGQRLKVKGYYGTGLCFAENENLIFRGNTFATKAVDTYMKMVGENVRISFLVLEWTS